MTWSTKEIERARLAHRFRCVAAAFLLVPELAALTPAFAQTPKSLAELMHALSGVGRVEARYREVVESALLQHPMSSAGSLSYRAPDELAKQADSGERLLIKGDSITIIDVRNQRQFSISDHETVQGLVSAMRATFAGDLAQLQQRYDLGFEPRDDGWMLNLTPKERRFLSIFERIQIQGRDNRIDRIDILEGNGDRRTLDLSDLEVSNSSSDAAD